MFLVNPVILKSGNNTAKKNAANIDIAPTMKDLSARLSGFL